MKEIGIKMDSADVKRLRDRIHDLTPILDTIGNTMVSHSQEAFKKSQFGTFRWPKQYGSQSPYIHRAGALQDLLSGGSIKARRFERGNPLIDAGHLSGSLDYRVVGGDTVEYGSALPYAGLHQTGGTSEQTVTKEAKKRLGKEFKKARKAGGTRYEQIKKLAILFHLATMKTKVFRRPFVGTTDEMENDIRENIEQAILDVAEKV